VKRRTPGRGFTLVEVLVALVVMAIMSLMAWQGVDGIARTREANEARLEQTLRLQTVISQWEQDLAALQESSAVPALTCDGQSVRLTRRTDGGLQVIAWSLRPDTNGSVWQRWAGPAVTTTTALQSSWLATQQFQGNEPGQVRALGGIDQWQVYFYQGNAWANCQSTGNVLTPAPALAPASASASAAAAAASAPAGPPVQALPSGVRLVLAFAAGSGMAGSLVRDTLIAP
jgi:general secretion pathway protein J